MARPVDLVTTDKIEAVRKAHNDLVNSGGDPEAIATLKSRVRRLEQTRSNQLNHPVHGPMLMALETSRGTAPVPATPLASVPKTTRKKQADPDLADSEPLTVKENKIRPESEWVSPGYDHYTGLMEAHDALSDAANNVADKRSEREAAPVFDHLGTALKHLTYHIEAHKNNEPEEAAKHLNSAAAGLIKGISALKALGETHVPIYTHSVPTGQRDEDGTLIKDDFGRPLSTPQYAKMDMGNLTKFVVSRAANYASEHADGTTAMAPAVRNVAPHARVPESGYNFADPDESKFTRDEKTAQNAYVKKPNMNSAWEQRSQPLANAPATEGSFEPRVSRVLAMYLRGGHIDETTGEVVSHPRAGTYEMQPRSMKPEELPFTPKEAENLGLSYKSKREYNKLYGQQLSRTIAQTVKARREFYLPEKLNRPAGTQVGDSEIAASSGQVISERKANYRQALIEKSLVPADGNVRPEHKDRVEMLINHTMNHLANKDLEEVNINTGAPEDPFKDLAPRVKQDLGPVGLEMAMDRHIERMSNAADVSSTFDDNEEDSSEHSDDIASATLHSFFEQNPGVRAPSRGIMGAIAKANESENVMNQVRGHISSGNLALAAKTHYEHFKGDSGVPFTRTQAYTDPEGYLREAGMSKRLETSPSTRAQRLGAAFRGE